MGITGLTNLINCKKLYSTKPVNSNGKKIDYYIDCMGQLYLIYDYITAMFERENSLNDNSMKENLILNNDFKKLMDINIDDFTTKAAEYIIQTILKCKENDKVTDDANIFIYFDYYHDVYPKIRLPMNYLIPIYNSMPENHKYSSIPLINNSDSNNYKALYYVMKDEDLTNYTNLYLIPNNEDKIHEILSSYIIKRYLKSYTRIQRLNNNNDYNENETDMEKYNKIHRGMISNLILYTIEKFNYINSNKYHLTDNIKFYGCDIESDFAIAKHVHENKDNYKKIITNDTDLLLLLYNVQNCEVILKTNKYVSKDNHIADYKDCAFDKNKLYEEVESIKETIYITPNKLWKFIITNTKYNNLIIYSCIKGNDYTKYLFNKNDKYHSTLIKLSRIEKNNKVDIERFIIDNKIPLDKQVYFDTIIWLYNNYNQLESDIPFDLNNQDFINKYKVTTDYLFNKHYTY